MRIAEYSLHKLLREIGQPRESELSGLLEVNTAALRVATMKMVMLAMGVGAAFPETAERILGSMATEPTAEATARLRERGVEYARADIAARPECSPWQAIGEHMLQGFPEEDLPWEVLEEFQGFFLILENTYVKGVVWGAAHVSAFNEALTLERERHESGAPESTGDGLEIREQFPWATNEDFFDAAARMVESYSEEVGPLPTISG